MSIPTYDATSVAPEDKTMGMVAYILAIFTSWIGPLILFLVKKDQSKFVAFHAMQALTLMGAVCSSSASRPHPGLPAPSGLIALPIAGHPSGVHPEHPRRPRRQQGPVVRDADRRQAYAKQFAGV